MNALNLFMSHVEIDGRLDGCWRWIGAKGPTGYGKFKFDGKVRPAHRVSWLLAGRDLPAGEPLDHLCRHRWCVNPDHLELVTTAENNARRPHGQLLKTHCPQGHAYDEANTYRPERGDRQCRTCNRARSKRRYDASPDQHRIASRNRQRTYRIASKESA